MKRAFRKYLANDEKQAKTVNILNLTHQAKISKKQKNGVFKEKTTHCLKLVDCEVRHPKSLCRFVFSGITLILARYLKIRPENVHTFS